MGWSCLSTAAPRPSESVEVASISARPSYPPLSMFKALLLQQWYSLSDPEIEEALADRLSFRRFVGLSLEQEVPDDSTISRFRQQLSGGLDEQLFGEVNRQLEARRLIIKRGTLIDASLIDASLIEAAVSKPAAGRGGENLGRGSALDPDAQWAHRKGGSGSHFGYKVHVAVDAGSGLVRKVLMTGAKTNDSEVADQLICGDEGALFADKAYDSSARGELLARLGIADGIMRRGWWGSVRDRRPDPQLVARNQALSKVRAQVERVFGLMKRGYHYRQVRYRGLVRNRTQLGLLCIAINLRRALVLSAA
jgi:IS5 family transposase